MVASKKHRDTIDDEPELDRFDEEENMAPEERLAGYEEFVEDDELTADRRRDPLRR